MQELHDYQNGSMNMAVLGSFEEEPLYFNYGKKYSESDLEYLCRFYEVDGCESVALALGYPPKSVAQKVYSLKKKGLYEKYKNQRKYWV